MMLNFFFYFFDTSIIRGGDIWAYDVSIGKEKKKNKNKKRLEDVNWVIRL